MRYVRIRVHDYIQHTAEVDNNGQTLALYQVYCRYTLKATVLGDLRFCEQTIESVEWFFSILQEAHLIPPLCVPAGSMIWGV